MGSIKPMMTAKAGYIVLSAALCVLGVVLIVKPNISAAILGTIIGIIMIVFGCVRIVGFLSKDLYRLAFQYDLIFGILMIVLGVIMLVNPDSLMTFICVALGVYFIAEGLFKIHTAVEARNFGIKLWWTIIIFAALTIVFGCVLLLRPGEGRTVLMVLLGIALLAEGIMNLCTVLTAVKIIRHQQPDVIEVEKYDIFE
ncbi:MAG: DUF308 domain-containing protein [Oscillospiraceae bacterium]|nr:DUF308 domain-containing protein [Oscillospiraceae bacterium]